MDNATAEYAFVTSFFANEPRPALQSKDSTSMMSPPILSPTRGEFDEVRSSPGSDFGSEAVSPRQRVLSITSVIGATGLDAPTPKEEQATLNALWKQIMDPVLDYCQVFRFANYGPNVLLTHARHSYRMLSNLHRRSYLCLQ